MWNFNHSWQTWIHLQYSSEKSCQIFGHQWIRISWPANLISFVGLKRQKHYEYVISTWPIYSKTPSYQCILYQYVRELKTYLLMLLSKIETTTLKKDKLSGPRKEADVIQNMTSELLIQVIQILCVLTFSKINLSTLLVLVLIQFITNWALFFKI